jgi:hypothetical protein
MENNIPQITFAIASKNNFRYVKYAVEYIRKNCLRRDHIIHIGIDGVDQELEYYYKNSNDNIIISTGVSGIAKIYNNIVKQTTTEFVIIYHADMIASKNMDYNLYKLWKPKNIISATRIEPPLHPADPSKIIQNFGLWPESNIKDGFDYTMFDSFVKNNTYDDKITHGVFAPWLISVKDYNSINGHDESLNSHSEDRDIFNRFLLNGFEFIQSWSSFVYHLTCRGGQYEHAKTTEDLIKKSDDWNKLANINTREFIRKWGSMPLYDNYQYPIINPKFSIFLNIYNISYEILHYIEPLFTKLYIDDETILSKYIHCEQKNTKYDLRERVCINKDLNDYEICISFDATNLTNESFYILQNIQKIIADSGEPGEFNIDIFNIKINRMIDYVNDLIVCNN